MARSPLDSHRATPAELQQRLAADRAGLPYMLFRNGDDRQEICALDPDSGRLAIGRAPRAHITVAWDAGVSWTHAVLDRVGDEWVIADHGLSTNGTYVNNQRVASQRLRHGDLVRLGSTLLVFQSPPSGAVDAPAPATTERVGGPPQLSDAQRRVLVELCRPYVVGGRAYPATNQEIATELHLSRVTVKGHLRALSDRFAIGQLPQNQKRAELMHRALETGAVTGDDYV